MLTILYSDDYFTAVLKPCGMLVHRSSIADDDAPVLLQQLRDQLGRVLYPVHRLDRPTSGLVLFAHSPEITRKLQEIMAREDSTKKYLALVRGWINEEVSSTRAVKNDRNQLREAQTRFVPLRHFEIPLATDRYPSARYSLIAAFPTTGRWHQIRQHLAQMRHYIINDRVHGDGKQNKLFTKQLTIPEMFLHAYEFSLTHPVSGEPILIQAPLPDHWDRWMNYAAATN